MKRIFSVASLLISGLLAAQNITLDTEFNTTGTNTYGVVYSTALQNDGKIIIAGAFSTYNGSAVNNIIRVNSDGSIDETFSLGFGPSSLSVIRVVKVLSDGKILVGGNFTSYDGNPFIKGLVRLNSDGSLDTGFTFQYLDDGEEVEVNDVEISDDGFIYAAGQFLAGTQTGPVARHLCRLNPDGSLENGFNPTIFQVSERVYDVSFASDGDVLASGTFFYGVKGGFAKLNPDGSLDSVFNAGYTVNGGGQKCCQLPDGTILIAGLLKQTFDENVFYMLFKINLDGTINQDFNAIISPDSTFNNAIYDLEVYGERVIVAGKGLSFLSGNDAGELFSIDFQGNVLSDFYTGNGFDRLNNIPYVYDISIQPDAKIIAGGYYEDYNDSSINGVSRLNGMSMNQGSFERVNSINVYYKETVNIFADSDNIETVEIYYMTGQLIFKQKVNAETISIPKMNAGLCIAHISLSNGVSQSLKIAL